MGDKSNGSVEYFLRYEDDWETVRMPFSSDKDAWETLRNLKQYGKMKSAILFRSEKITKIVNIKEFNMKDGKHKKMVTNHWVPVVIGHINDSWDID
jgi:hypothetical protein